MNSIDKKIKMEFEKDNYIPKQTIKIINQTLDENKNNIKIKKKINIKNKIVAIITSIGVMIFGSMTVYAVTGGKISGKPVSEWLGLRFSDEYENYKVDVTGQNVTYNETTVDLISTVCDDGYTILEFDLKLSENDKEYLRIGKSIVTDEDLEYAKEADEKNKNNLGYLSSYDSLIKYQEMTNIPKLEFNKNLDAPENKAYNILIDDEGYGVMDYQTVSKISESEYKIYQMYFFTDKELNNKTNFKLTLKLDDICNGSNVDDYTGDKKDGVLINTETNSKKIEMSGEFNVEVSKDKAVENTQIINEDIADLKYKNMTKSIEEIKVTPLQIIVKIDTVIEDVSLISLTSTRNKDYIGLIQYNVYDNNGNKLSNFNFEKSRTITYSNGKKEEWSSGDIGTYKDFYGATMYLTEYIIIEKKDDVQGISIVPNVEEFGYDENSNFDSEIIDLEAFKFDL